MEPNSNPMVAKRSRILLDSPVPQALNTRPQRIFYIFVAMWRRSSLRVLLGFKVPKLRSVPQIPTTPELQPLTPPPP